MLENILSKCDERNRLHKCTKCEYCSYDKYCPHNCEKCLDYIHYPQHAPKGAPERKYDCIHMADVYTCKYSCRYASEIVYAVERLKDLSNLRELKVLSFGCGPCTDLFAIDYLHSLRSLAYQKLEYRGVDYSENVWKYIHNDIKKFENESLKIKFYYKDMCEIIHTIAQGDWIPNLIVFQYIFSDMKKHSTSENINIFINTFAEYYNKKVLPNTYIILNDVNLGNNYNGGRDYFEQLYESIFGSTFRKGRFCNDNSINNYYPRGYTYGEDSDGEFPTNVNRFDLSRWQGYSPFKTCASAQMIIKKV